MSAPAIPVERFLAILADVRAALTTTLGVEQALEALATAMEGCNLDPWWDEAVVLSAAEHEWGGDVEGFIDTTLAYIGFQFTTNTIAKIPESLRSAYDDELRERAKAAKVRREVRWEEEDKRAAFEKMAKKAGYVLAADFTVTAVAPAPPPLYGPGTFGVPGALEDLEPFMSRKALKALLYLYRRADAQGYVTTSSKTLSRFLGSWEEQAGRRMLKRFQRAGLIAKLKRPKGMPSAGQDAHRNLLRYYRLLTPPADLSAAKAIFQAHTGRWPEKGQVVEAQSQSGSPASLGSGPLDTGL